MDSILHAFESTGITPSAFLINLMTQTKYKNHTFINDLSSNATDLCSRLKMVNGSAVTTWAVKVTRESYGSELQSLISESPEWRFSALHASARKVEEFKIDEMAGKIKVRAPMLWSLLGSLLSIHNIIAPEPDSQEEEVSSDSELWEHFGDIDIEGMIEMIKDDDQGTARQRRKAAKKEAILTVVRLLKIYTILLQSPIPFKLW
jgi:hypothetical protein